MWMDFSRHTQRTVWEQQTDVSSHRASAGPGCPSVSTGVRLTEMNNSDPEPELRPAGREVGRLPAKEEAKASVSRAGALLPAPRQH